MSRLRFVRNMQLRVSLGTALWIAALSLNTVLTASSANAQGLTYVEADEFSNLSPSSGIMVAATGTDDNLWTRRGFGVASTVYESGNENVPELTQRIDSLNPGTSYDVYVVHWTNAANWTIAGGLTPGQQVIYNRAGPNPYFPTAKASTPAGFSYWTSPPPIVQEQDRVMVIGKIGTMAANPSGQINVYINDPGGQGTTDARSWLDGVAYAPANASVTLSAEINRTTGALTINNPTSVSFQVRSISIQSGAGTLNAANWTSVTNNYDADNGGAFDANDAWSITTTSATTLAEAEPATPLVVGGTLAAGSTLHLGNVVQKSVYEDVSVVLALDDIDGSTSTNDTFRLIANYSGGTAIQEGDFNADGVVDIANDFASLLSNLNKNASTGLNAYERYQSGDMTNNNRVTYADLQLFRKAYDDANGSGAFAAAVGVPEPASLAIAALGFCGVWASMRRRAGVRRQTSLCYTATARAMSAAIVAVSLAAGASVAQAVPVTGWAIDPTVGIGNPSNAAPDPVLAGAGTASPTLGDGTMNNADSVAIYASMPQISLADGQEITLSGSVAMSGSENPAHGDFRWGLFNAGTSPNTLAWRGYLAENASGGNAGTLNSKDPSDPQFATRSFAVTGEGVGVGITNTLDPEESLFVNGTFNFSLTVGRFGDEVSARGSLTSASGFSNVYLPGTDPASAGRLTFDFNRVGFLAGGNLGADQMAFSGINVTGPTPISALTLRVTTSGPNAGLTEIVNSVAGGPVDISYYELSSVGGSLDLGGYTSLDDQENGDPLGVGWDESGSNSGVFISETNLFGSSTLALNDSLDLGLAFNAGGLEDLRFQYGLADGTLVRGLVEYVAGPSNLPGDFNGDTVVDGADLTKWRGDFGPGDGSDADDDGDSDGNDFLIWQRNVGNSAATASAAPVPEPAALLLTIVGATALAGLARSRRG